MNEVGNQAAQGLMSGMGGRQSAEAVLRQKAEQHRRTAERLEALASIAGGLSGDAESAMWELAITA